MNDIFTKNLRKFLRKAEVAGIKRPVVAVADLSTRRVRALLSAADSLRPLPPSSRSSPEPIPVAVWQVPDTVRLLQEHGRVGGYAVSLLLRGQPNPEPDWWSVALFSQHLAVAGVASGGGVIMGSATYYDRAAFALCPCCRQGRKAGEGLAVLPIKGDAGEVVPVCGPSTQDVGEAAALARIASRRSLPCVPRKEKSVDLPVDDELLARILLQVYAGSPVAVAEAVRVLRKRGDDGADWLLRMLGSRGPLRYLAKKVHEQLGDIE